MGESRYWRRGVADDVLLLLELGALPCIVRLQ
jgi:hypothetical protein